MNPESLQGENKKDLTPRTLIQKQIVEIGIKIDNAQSESERQRLMDEALRLKNQLEQLEKAG